MLLYVFYRYVLCCHGAFPNQHDDKDTQTNWYKDRVIHQQTEGYIMLYPHFAKHTLIHTACITYILHTLLRLCLRQKLSNLSHFLTFTYQLRLISKKKVFVLKDSPTPLLDNWIQNHGMDVVISTYSSGSSWVTSSCEHHNGKTTGEEVCWKNF